MPCLCHVVPLLLSDRDLPRIPSIHTKKHHHLIGDEEKLWKISQKMQSLLSPAESHAFQSFLSTMDYPDDSITPAEWAIYNAGGQIYNGQEDPMLNSESNSEQREALMKATKDLMSLDADNWEGGISAVNHHHNQPPQQMYGGHGQPMENYDLQHGQHFAHQQQQQQHQQHDQHRHNSFSASRDLFPFLHNKVQHQHPSNELQYSSHSELQQQHPHLVTSSMNGVNSDRPSPTSPHSPFLFQPQQHNSLPMPIHQQQPQHQHQQPSQPHRVHIPAQTHQRGMSPASRSSPLSRSRLPQSGSAASTQESLQASTSSHNSRPSSSSNGTRSHTNNTNGNKRVRSSGSPAISVTTTTQQHSAAAKQTLLSPSQKKANHIQSEQKRRANIRRGYEALCESVPALREAIREEEEAERNGTSQRGAGANGSGGQRKKGRSKKGQKDGDEQEKDKLDGRAGPRSENVVLSKTIEHIQALLGDRSSLLARLHRARSSLPPGHPALTPCVADPPWEREWKGGDGRLGDEDPDGDGGSDGEDEGDEE